MKDLLWNCLATLIVAVAVAVFVVILRCGEAT